MFFLPKLSEALRTLVAAAVGENRPLVKVPSTPSREPRDGEGFGTSRVWRCLRPAPGGCNAPDELGVNAPPV